MSVRTRPAPNVTHSENGRRDAVEDAAGRAGRLRIGDKLRTLRLKKKIGLVELGKHTGLSPALLSKIERGRMFPTLPTLLRIALVFGVGLEFFFAGARDKPLVAVVRKADRVRLPDRPGAREVAYRFESLDYPATERRFNCYYAEFFPVAPGPATAARSSGRRVHLRDPGHAERAHGRRGACARGGRLHVFRFERSPRLPAQRRPDLQRRRRDSSVARRVRYSFAGRGFSAGPEITSPSGVKREPWHGQSHVRSASFQPTTQPMCVQMAERNVSDPSGRDTRRPSHRRVR